MVIEIFKFENRKSDGENFLPIGRDNSPLYFVLYALIYPFHVELLLKSYIYSLVSNF